MNKLIEENFTKRNIGVVFFGCFSEAKEYLLEEIPNSATIGIGNSQTLKGMGITDAFAARGNIVYDKELAKSPEEKMQLNKQSLLSDYYVSSANAVSADGRIVNIDHSGNRVAALAYGPDRVFLVVGKNKITHTFEQAMTRAKNTSAPANARRAGHNPPCVELGYCVDCHSPERVCNIISVIEGQSVKGRLTLLIVDEDAGF
ncbi:MAG: lactate utilization protein [Defluviitaleaceae bacterium]|nr:lactate utilization protein [Defluviitaleaceae bacterium]